ncbi:MAG TPA: EAL domain-containing protein [Nocardioidaceae bacterium]|nr:EAL domain-containing protein [Nocardioidaceae bacterium]
MARATRRSPLETARAELRVSETTVADTRRELEDVHARLANAEDTLRAIRSGEVDAVVVASGVGSDRVFTLSSADRSYRNFVENMSDGAATVSAGGIVLYANQALADLLGLSCQQVVGQPLADLFTGSSSERLTGMLAPGSGRGSVEAMLLTAEADATPVRLAASSLEVNGVTVTCITVTDLTVERRAEKLLAHSAQHDALTGLTNRSLLTDRIQHALDRRASGNDVLALLFCDIDGFKNVNDAYGHAVGDETLCTVARRLTETVRPEDTVARIGGDEFVILCEGLVDLTDAALVASRVRAAVSEPFWSGSAQLDVTLSIGIAVASVNEKANPDTLLRDADEAMYKAKRQGPNVIEMFDEPLRLVASSRLQLLSDLRHAAIGEELRLFYQPVLGLDTQTVIGAEALIRWEHPVRGWVQPDDFIPFAERSGLIVGIGDWVMREACRQAARWAPGDGTFPLHMAVNVSGRQLAQGAGLLQSVRSALDEFAVDPTALVIEVTESALMDDAEAALLVLNQLKSLGVRIAIDDFGTGYSSLVYLKRFPVDQLKVDRSFVAGLGQSHDDASIVQSVINLAHAFGITAVAEGIETQEHLDILRDLGCSYGQGYLWSPAVPATKFDTRRWDSRLAATRP